MMLKGTTADVVVFGLLVVTLLVPAGCSNTVPAGDSRDPTVGEDTGLRDDEPSDTVVCPPEYDGPPAELFPTFSDDHTVVLWLFDDPEYPNATLGDAGGNEYDLRLMGGGELGSGRGWHGPAFRAQIGLRGQLRRLAGVRSPTNRCGTRTVCPAACGARRWLPGTYSTPGFAVSGRLSFACASPVFRTKTLPYLIWVMPTRLDLPCT